MAPDRPSEADSIGTRDLQGECHSSIGMGCIYLDELCMFFWGAKIMRS